MKMLGVLQARMSSRRLPGKVLAPVLGEPMILRQIERLRRSRTLGGLVVAISADPGDARLLDVCAERGITVHRGSLDDVLGRVVEAARPHAPRAVVRLTADCPLADPDVIDRVVGAFRENELDYAGNIDPPTWPDGLDVEVIRFEALLDAAERAELPEEREHVTLFIRRHPELYPSVNVTADVDRSHLRWTVDEPADLDFVRAVYERLYPRKPDFRMDDILALLEREPELAELNAGLVRDAEPRKQ